MKKVKIYCENCQYFSRRFKAPDSDYLCRRSELEYYDAIGKHKKYQKCIDKNNDNDCRDYLKKGKRFWIF